MNNNDLSVIITVKSFSAVKYSCGNSNGYYYGS